MNKKVIKILYKWKILFLYKKLNGRVIVMFGFNYISRILVIVVV